MSKAVSSGRWGFRLAILALAFGLALSAAQGQTRRDRNESVGERIRRESEIAAQKMEDEVITALVQARKLGKADPARAVARLQKALIALENDEALTENRRGRLIRVLKLKIREWNDKLASSSREKASRRDVRERTEHQRGDGDRERRDRVEKYKESIRGARDSVNEQKRLAREKNRAIRGIYRSIEEASIPIVNDVEFPKDWKKRMALRPKTVLTKKEAFILKMLNSVMSADFRDQKFEEIISYIEDKTGLTILVDKEALKDAMVDYETPITLKVKKVSVRALLRKLLSDLNLTYIIKDEIIQVTSFEKARKSMVVRAYPVADLVTANVDFRLPPAAQQVQILQNAAQLVELVKSTVEPQSWANPDAEDGGGGATISFNLSTMSLVIKQSAELHYAMRKAIFGR
jgi:hypothetical protein